MPSGKNRAPVIQAVSSGAKKYIPFLTLNIHKIPHRDQKGPGSQTDQR